ncbi:hypothetical protein HK100_011255 [Physocladia obscura]|uniref:NYN domain-containing protein n=1 Tax=Physocladia obscura TaxID=109957 RepID=A0AAD5XH38_9FUNG|nr:hypothetical protein HK100_011255 [Physocladia obscura]
MTAETQSDETVSVYWDIENCACPASIRGILIVRRIKDFLKSKNLVLLEIRAIGDISKINAVSQTELQESGVVLQNVSSGKPNAADISILGEIMKLIYYRRPPHTIVLISGDRDFSVVLNFLETVGYRVILIHSKQISDVLRMSVRETIQWTEMLQGSPLFPSPFVPSLHSNNTRILDTAISPVAAAMYQKTTHTRSPPVILSQTQKTEFLYPKSPERVLMLLREIKHCCHKNANKKVRFSDIPKFVAPACGFANSRQFIEWAARYKYITILDNDSVDIEPLGYKIIDKFHGKEVKRILCRAPVMEKISDQFRLIIECLFEIVSDGTDVNVTDLINLLELNFKRIKSFNFLNSKDYFNAALQRGIISINSSGSTVSVVTELAANGIFEPLVQAICIRGPNGVHQSKLGSDSTKFGWKELGYDRFSDYLHAAVEARVVTVSYDVLQKDSIVEISKTSQNIGPNDLSHEVPKLSSSPPHTFPQSMGPQILPATTKLPNNSAQINTVFNPLIKAICARGSSAAQSILGADAVKYEFGWKELGYVRFSEYLKAAVDAGVVTMEYDAAQKDNIVSVSNTSRDGCAPISTVFQPLVQAFRTRGVNSISQSILGSDSARFGIKEMGFSRFSAYLQAAIDAGIVTKYNLSTIDFTVELSTAIQNMDEAFVLTSANVSKDEEIKAEKLAEGKTEVIETDFVWKCGGEKVFLKGSWDSWDKQIDLLKYEDGFRVKLALLPGVYEYKFIVDGVWIADFEKPLIPEHGNNMIHV